MQDLDSILKKIDDGINIKEVRITIADLIKQHLQALQSSLGYWEKFHFANAIASLAWNINSPYQPTTAWLRLCLVNVEKVLVPANQRDENYVPLDKGIVSITYEQLMEDITLLRQNELLIRKDN